jgi:hypothetical protein
MVKIMGNFHICKKGKEKLAHLEAKFFLRLHLILHLLEALVESSHRPLQSKTYC